MVLDFFTISNVDYWISTILRHCTPYFLKTSLVKRSLKKTKSMVKLERNVYL